MAHITGLAYGTAHWVRLRSVDRSGNASGWSTTASITLLQVVDTDLASTAGMADKIAGIIGTFGTTITNWLQAGHIEAGSFNGYVIKGADIISETPGDPLNFIRLNDRTLTVQRDNGEPVPESVVTAQFGGPVSDQLLLRDTTGSMRAMLDAGTGNGSVVGQFSVGDQLYVGGKSLTEILDPLPKGLVSILKSSGDSDVAGSSELGYIKLQAEVSSDRYYRMSIGGIAAVTTANDRFRVWFKTWDGTQWVTLHMDQMVIPTTTGEHFYTETKFRAPLTANAGFYISFQNATAP